MSNKFEKQLESLLSEELDSLPDENSEDEEEEHIDRDMSPVEFERKETNLVKSEENSDYYDDYVFARSQYYGLIGRSNAALDLVLEIAKMSEHPRAIEVAATLMKTSTNITKDLMELQDRHQGGSEKEPSGKYIQNNTHHHYSSNKDVEDIIDDLDDEEETPKK